MKQPAHKHQHNEDKKKPEENSSRGIDPKSEEEQVEVVDENPRERQKENQNQKKMTIWPPKSVVRWRGYALRAARFGAGATALSKARPSLSLPSAT